MNLEEKMSLSHFFGKFWILFQESMFPGCVRGHSLLWKMCSHGMWRHLLSHDSFPVELKAFNAKVYIYEGISRSNSYIQWKVEVLLFFKYLKITKWFSSDLSSCKGGSGEKNLCLQRRVIFPDSKSNSDSYVVLLNPLWKKNTSKI